MRHVVICGWCNVYVWALMGCSVFWDVVAVAGPLQVISLYGHLDVVRVVGEGDKRLLFDNGAVLPMEQVGARQKKTKVRML